MEQGDFLDVLKERDSQEISLIYADFTSQFGTVVRPLLDYLKTINLRTGTILGITWSSCGDKINNKKNQKELCLFEYKQDWKEIEHDIFGEYGHAKNMNIVFFVKE
tara:strand:- start:321 stop:638 length:318 start_codon:yes stop_codon:yes gene_type:complete